MLPLEDGEPIDSVEDEDDILDAELCGKLEFIIMFVTDIVTMQLLHVHRVATVNPRLPIFEHQSRNNKFSFQFLINVL